MAKPKQSYVCNACGDVQSKWSGQCAACGTWGSISDEPVAANQGYSKSNADIFGKSLDLQPLSGSSEPAPRKETGISEFDRVLGGGIVPGSAILLGGDPGIGKSTLLLQLVAQMGAAGLNCIYITGEESLEQVRLRARRLKITESNVQLAASTSVADAIQTIKKLKPDLVIIDSIQTMYIDTIESAPGTVSQVRTASHELIQLAKTSGTTVILVGHVTKDGQIAGPKVLEHMVDTVLYFEGDRGHQYRIIRAVKNRFGGAGEIGVFEMSDVGLREVTNPSELFISGRAGEVSGSVVFPAMEGTRPLMLEIQALVSPTTMAMPRRAVVGWDANRLSMLLAVLQTRAGVPLADKEVYLNVAGGIKIQEPAADLAVACAVLSALTSLPMLPGGVIFGEIGLSGEVRAVSQVAARIRESKKLGFSGSLSPTFTTADKQIANSLKPFILHEIQYITQAKDFLACGTPSATSREHSKLDVPAE